MDSLLRNVKLSLRQFRSPGNKARLVKTVGKQIGESYEGLPTC